MWNDIIGEYVKHLEKVLPITPWTSLDLSCEKLHDRLRKEIKNEMKKWRDNNIGDEGAAKISESLMINTTLTELYLHGGLFTGNKIGAEGAAKISESLMTNTTLTKLDLSGNDNIMKN